MDGFFLFCGMGHACHRSAKIPAMAPLHLKASAVISARPN
ncbi:hypothetical protein RTCIAT899_CH01655 [Rhizobium tropici CIAT 899]|nr:hypothetical protein RTCIAT899_CH01655 [Rhizobium tropici CIAT 899]